jgi:hypothetical protein
MKPMKAVWPMAATTNQRTPAQRRAVAPALDGNGDEDGIGMAFPDATLRVRPTAGMAATRVSGLADLEFG